MKQKKKQLDPMATSPWVEVIMRIASTVVLILIVTGFAMNGGTKLGQQLEFGTTELLFIACAFCAFVLCACMPAKSQEGQWLLVPNNVNVTTINFFGYAGLAGIHILLLTELAAASSFFWLEDWLVPQVVRHNITWLAWLVGILWTWFAYEFYFKLLGTLRNFWQFWQGVLPKERTTTDELTRRLLRQIVEDEDKRRRRLLLEQDSLLNMGKKGPFEVGDGSVKPLQTIKKKKRPVRPLVFRNRMQNIYTLRRW